MVELQLSLRMWDHYLAAVADLDAVIDAQLRATRRSSPLPPQTRVRGRKPHDPKFDVRTALYLSTGVDLTAVEGIDAVQSGRVLELLGWLLDRELGS